MFESKTYEVLVKSALSRVSSALDKREGSMVMNGVAPVSYTHLMNIQSMYSDIDLDANAIEMEFAASMDELLWFVNAHFANTGKKSFDGTKVKIIFDRDVLINDTEAINN